jgi:hypothetical protein
MARVVTARPVLACGGPIAADKAPWWLGAWQSNGDLIAEVARLGYLDGQVLDATYGLGTFWKHYKPDDLVTNDLYVGGADYAYDYRELPIEWERQFDAVVFDPDYKLNGTPALGEFDARYGTGGDVSRAQRYKSILEGASECARVAKRYLLVKCQDQVESGRQWWMADDVKARLAGWRKVEEFYYLGGGRPQPAGRDKRCPLDTDNDGNCPACRGSGAGYPGCVDGRVPSEQQHAYGRPSKLLIFARPGRTR